MSEKEKKLSQNEEVGMDTQALDAIMEEALKEMFSEVADADEQKKRKKKKKRKPVDHVVSPASENEAGSPEEKTEEEEAVLTEEDGEELEPELTAEDGEELEPELLEADGENFEEEEEPMTEEEKAERRRKRKKAAKITAASILGLIAVVYLGFSVFFMSHFQFGTKINGVEFGLKAVKDVEAYMEQQVQGYELALKKSDGSVEKIIGSEIALVYKQGEELNELLRNQNAFLWPKSLWEVPEITAAVGVEYDKAALAEKLKALDCMKEENQSAPVSAKPEFDGNEFTVKKEEIGSTILPEVFEEKVNTAIQGFLPELDLAEESCYVVPKYTEESKEVADACSAMNDYLKAKITYTFDSGNDVVDETVISQWLTTDDEMNVTFNKEAVSAYIDELASKYNTYQTQRTFVSGNGNTVNVQGGDYGWIVDKKAEYEALVQNIEKRETVDREPVYSRKAASHATPDWGTTYVEVDLTNQYMYLFVNGAVVTSGPIVTGKPSTGAATPQGVYFIKYCARNATLRGPKKPDGSYEWESPVSYWMPFNGGIGLHDAPWQAAFGGNRYLTHGSHGCVNLQFNVAKTVFANVTAGTPVVCHY